jgi:hypothetical protein
MPVLERNLFADGKPASGELQHRPESPAPLARFIS